MRFVIARTPKILILTPFRNEEHSIPQYLKSLESVEYPRDLIDVYWLENDSSDLTFEMLEEAKQKMPFRTTLKSIHIYGPVEKKPPGIYWKDIPHGAKRVKPWYVIWNDNFLPLIRKWTGDYVLAWYADTVAPPNVITEYLKVMQEKPDAGWVGGSIYRRYPRHRELHCPIPHELAESREVVEVHYVGHCWMMSRQSLEKARFYEYSKGIDYHESIIKCLLDQGLKVYYQPSIHLKHISTDGKIYA